MRRSLRFVGEAPIYLPVRAAKGWLSGISVFFLLQSVLCGTFVNGRVGRVTAENGDSRPGQWNKPPSPADTRYGTWYSHPAGGSCVEGAALGADGCTWRRLPVGRVVSGPQLLAAGFWAAAHSVRPGAVKRPQRFPTKTHFVWGFCVGVRGLNRRKRRFLARAVGLDQGRPLRPQRRRPARGLRPCPRRGALLRLLMVMAVCKSHGGYTPALSSH
jgi:hypothetical protein